jgi:deoxyribonuclease V
VETADRVGDVRLVAGVDVGFHRARRLVRAAVAVLRLPSMELVASATAVAPAGFPYVPGLLSFREIPVVLEAWHDVAETPDAILCDGQGYAHPRRFGLACHLGVLLDLPTIGVAKSRLLGEHGVVPAARGAWTALTHQGEVVGAVLRTRAGVSPLYVSCGHRISLERAVAMVMACTTRFRLPETTRMAHHLASTTPWEA